MPDQPITEPHGLNRAEVDTHAQGFANAVRQVGTRHGSVWAMVEASGCMLASLVLLKELCSTEAARDTLAWFAERATVPLGPEAYPPRVLTDDGLSLPAPRTVSESSHHIVRNVRRIARCDGDRRALEITCGALRAGIAVAREELGAEKLADMLNRYVAMAATMAVAQPEEIMAARPEGMQ